MPCGRVQNLAVRRVSAWRRCFGRSGGSVRQPKKIVSQCSRDGRLQHSATKTRAARGRARWLRSHLVSREQSETPRGRTRMGGALARPGSGAEMDEPSIAQDWGRSGIEPALHELMNDPIMHLLLRRDGLTSEAVWRFVEQARDRLGKPDGSPASIGITASQRPAPALFATTRRRIR